jgi:thiopurine S-methyltransferase
MSVNIPVGDIKGGVNALEDWSARWREGRSGWHLGDVNQLLTKHFDIMIDGRTDIQIFVPLCGKTKDLKWMHDQGHRIVGVEFDEQVVRELFSESDFSIETVEEHGALKLFKTKDER